MHLYSVNYVNTVCMMSNELLLWIYIMMILKYNYVLNID